jgi:hypothetical protein
MMKTWMKIVALCVVALAVTTACTKELDIEVPEGSEQIVVDGSIDINRPPIITLTKSVKFFDNIDLNDLGSYFVHGANITINRGTDTVHLQEFCLNSLPLSPEEQQIVLQALGFNSYDSSSIPDICVYTVPDIVNYFISGNCSFMGQELNTYDMRIDVNGKTLTSSTRIPKAIGIDSLSVGVHPNPAYQDSFAPVYAYFTVPDTFGNFVRYWTQRNDEPFYLPLSASVYDDKLFVGLQIGLPLERGQPSSNEFDVNTYMYFHRNDSVQVRWANIDSKSYDFFYTLENDGGGSPFSSPVKVKTNINGGLGAWVGYASKYYNIVVK